MNYTAEAERSVLGGIMLGGGLPPEVEQLTPHDFDIPQHAAIFAAMRDLAQRQEPIDEITVRPLVEAANPPEGGWGRYLSDLSDGVPTAANVGHYSLIVRREARRRAFVDVMLRAVKQAQRSGSDSEEILGGAVRELGLIAEGSETVRPVTIREVLREELATLQKRYNSSEIPGLATGFPEIDTTLGGLHPGNLVVLAARPSMGKSSLARNILANVTGRGLRRGILFSLEMTRDELGQAFLAAEAGVSLMRLRNGDLDPVHFAKLTEAMQAFHHDRLAIVDKPYLRISDIRSITRQFAARGGCDLMVVDYLQLITPDDAPSREQEISTISRGLKTLAMELKIPVVAVAQLNREVEKRPNKRPLLSDLRDSGSIEQDANQVLMIYRDDYYNPDSKQKGVAEICVAKNRNGPTGKIELRWVEQYTRFQSQEVRR